jgi:CubicO group peptidase (beta-lactamase class C family)
MPRSPVSALAALLLATPLAAAPPALPDSPASPRAAALVRLLAGPGAPTPEATLRFVEENYSATALAERSAAERAARFERAFDDAGGGEMVLAAAEGDTAVVVVFKNATRHLWITFRIEVEPSPPHRIVGIGAQAGDEPPPASLGGPALAAEQAWRELGAELDRRAGDDRFSGVVLVARNGVPQFERAVGMAERGHGVPVRIDTKFNLGSINKIFTELVLRQLQAEGRLALDDRLSRHLPDLPSREIASQITLQQMLEHRSGLGDFFGERFDATNPTAIRALADYLPFIVGRPPEFAPGTSQRYSNAGYLLLGLVIEKVTGQSYYDAVRERVFVPAGMVDTASYAGDEIVPNLASGYTRGGPGVAAGALRSNVYLRPGRGSSAGGGYSTAPDLLRFEQALRKGTIGPNDPWVARGGPGIAGGADGINAALEGNWRTGWTVIVLSNLDPPSAQEVSKFVRGLLGRIAPGR